VRGSSESRNTSQNLLEKKQFGPWSPPHGRLQGRLKPYPNHLLPRSPAAATGGSRRTKPGRCRLRGPPLYLAQVLPRWGWRARGSAQWWFFLRGKAAGRQATEAAAQLGVVGWRRGGAGAAGRRGGDGQDPLAQIWALRGPSGPRRACLFLFADVSWSWSRWCGAVQEGAAALTYVKDFTGPIWARPGLQGLVCPYCCVWSAPAVGGGGSPPGGCVAAPSGSCAPTSSGSQVMR
jgi:hypothetical protein